MSHYGSANLNLNFIFNARSPTPESNSSQHHGQHNFLSDKTSSVADDFIEK
jgi:hypothetical protein